jgi:hypothetical protein
MILLTIHADPSVIGRDLQFITEGAELLRFMRSRLHFEDLFEPSPSPKTRTQSSRAKPTPKPKSPSSVSEPKRKPPAPANTTSSGPTTAEKVGAAAQGVAKGLAVGLGTDLAIGFVAGATGVAASTIFLILLPFPIYAIATHWGAITSKASRLYVGKGTLHDYKAIGAAAGGFLSIGATGSAIDLGIETGQAVGESFGALCSDESQDEDDYIAYLQGTSKL